MNNFCKRMGGLYLSWTQPLLPKAPPSCWERCHSILLVFLSTEWGGARLQPSPDTLPAPRCCRERCRTPLPSTSSRCCGSCWRLCCSATLCWWERSCWLAGRRISWCSNDNLFPAPAVLGCPEAPGSTAQLVPHICSAHRMAAPSSCTNSASILFRYHLITILFSYVKKKD